MLYVNLQWSIPADVHTRIKDGIGLIIIAVMYYYETHFEVQRKQNIWEEIHKFLVASQNVLIMITSGKVWLT